MTLHLRAGQSTATGMHYISDTYYQCEESEATHIAEIPDGEHHGCLRFTPPSWELHFDYHHLVTAL